MGFLEYAVFTPEHGVLQGPSGYKNCCVALGTGMGISSVLECLCNSKGRTKRLLSHEKVLDLG